MSYRAVQVRPTDRWLVGTGIKPTPDASLALHRLMDSDTGDRFLWTSDRWIRTHIAGAPITDFTAGDQKVNKFGENPLIPIDTEYPIWDGIVDYPYPDITNADITHIRQTTDQIAMRGQTIEVTGLNIVKDEVIQTITLDATNTTTPVVLITPLVRIARKKVLANVVTDQNIESTNAAGTIVYSIIQAGNNQTLMALYTIPRNKVGLLTIFHATVVDATNKTPTATEIKLWTADRFNGYEFQLKNASGIPLSGTMAPVEYDPYQVIPQVTDIKLTAKPLGEPAHVFGRFSIKILDMI